MNVLCTPSLRYYTATTGAGVRRTTKESVDGRVTAYPRLQQPQQQQQQLVVQSDPVIPPF